MCVQNERSHLQLNQAIETGEHEGLVGWREKWACSVIASQSSCWDCVCTELSGSYLLSWAESTICKPSWKVDLCHAHISLQSHSGLCAIAVTVCLEV